MQAEQGHYTYEFVKNGGTCPKWRDVPTVPSVPTSMSEAIEYY